MDTKGFSQWAQWRLTRFFAFEGHNGAPAALPHIRALARLWRVSYSVASGVFINRPEAILNLIPPRGGTSVCAANAPQALHCAPQREDVLKAFIVASKAIVPIVKKPLCPLW